MYLPVSEAIPVSDYSDRIGLFRSRVAPAVTGVSVVSVAAVVLELSVLTQLHFIGVSPDVWVDLPDAVLSKLSRWLCR